jgi:rhodanese-related sulfurtransferase
MRPLPVGLANPGYPDRQNHGLGRAIMSGLAGAARPFAGAAVILSEVAGSMRPFLIAAIVLLLGWDAVWWALGVKPRFPWQLQARLRAGASDLVLLDVRTPLEYNWFHLPGALNIPDLLADSGKMPPVSPSQEVVVICLTGHRSPLAAFALKKRGYTRVYHLTWGMVGYKVCEWFSHLRGCGEPPKTRE